MSDYQERFADAKEIYERGLLNVKHNSQPEGQKFDCGSRVLIDKDLGSTMSHFTSGKKATVKYTYAHAYGGDNTDSYCLDVDGEGRVSWYKEHQLTQIEE